MVDMIIPTNLVCVLFDPPIPSIYVAFIVVGVSITPERGHLDNLATKTGFQGIQIGRVPL